MCVHVSTCHLSLSLFSFPSSSTCTIWRWWSHVPVEFFFRKAGRISGHQESALCSPLTPALISNMSYHADRWWRSKRFLSRAQWACRVQLGHKLEDNLIEYLICLCWAGTWKGAMVNVAVFDRRSLFSFRFSLSLTHFSPLLLLVPDSTSPLLDVSISVYISFVLDVCRNVSLF